MPLVIPKKVRGLVETYVMSYHRNVEKGGYLIGRENAIVAFLPIPNFSTGNHSESYSIGKEQTKEYADEFAAMLSAKVLGDVHTHPNGTVPSEQDGRYVRGLSWQYHVILADCGDRFDWYCVDNQFRGVTLTESDKELEGIMELVAGELSLRNLGTFFLTPAGELVSTKAEGLGFVTPDRDALVIADWSMKLKDRSYRLERTMAQCVRDTHLPLSAVRRVFEKFGWR